MKKLKIFVNKPVSLGLSVLEITKIVIYEFWYDFIKPKYREKAKLCYINTNNIIVYINGEDIYLDIARHVETKFDTWNYELNRPLHKKR